MSSSTDPSWSLVLIPRFVGLIAPTLYAGFTLSDSLTFVQPIIDHAPSAKTMAKQWLRGYQYGPLWVPPMIVPGTLANVYLATIAPSPTHSVLYIFAALCVFSVAPITFLYMEPGINGALKWKVQLLLRDEGFHMPETSVFLPHAHRHGSTKTSRKWAEQTEIKELIAVWRRINNFRWAIGAVAALLSGMATLSQIPS